MNIINNYDGASIKIINNDVENNIVYLSLKEENGKFSHYYNFISENQEDRKGTIYIQNLKASPYFKKDLICAPYIKNTNWERLKDYNIDENGELVINIEPKTKQEISLVPRYIQENLKEFINKKNNQSLKIVYEPIDEILIGNTTLPTVVFTARQHPGETLSSFFIEGVIDEILESSKMMDKYCFVIYPFVNKNGVKNGNHRYTNGVDYNRSWNKKNAPEEIEIIKRNLEKINIKYFIDVHNDEVTKENYIRTSCNELGKDNIAGIRVLQNASKTRKFIRALIKQKRIINVFSKTANEYVYKKYKCKALLIELSMSENYQNAYEIGRNFIKELFGE